MAISFEGQILAQILVSDLFTGKLGHEPEEREEEGTGRRRERRQVEIF